MSANPVEYSDIQGLVRFGYGALTQASFLLLEVRDRRAAAAWLASAPVSNAVELDKPPQTALQVALTYPGLQTLGVPPSVLAGFSDEFQSGMWGPENRSRRLGDLGQSSPAAWTWGGPDKVPHIVVMAYAQSGLDTFIESIKGANWDTAFSLIQSLSTSDLDGVEPFGFRDGISQPTPDWDRRRTTEDQLRYTNLACLGEFVLGYSNEYGHYTDRPLLANDPGNSSLPQAEDVPDLRDLGRNGTYLVLRQLQQAVRGFWQFVDAQAGGDPQKREQLASAMVGRTRDGEPIAPPCSSPIAGVDPRPPSNQFNFDSDVDASRCPFGAHIRRSNPRNADFPEGTAGFFSKIAHDLGLKHLEFRQDIMSSTRFHRLLRRGREYGPGLTPEQALQPGYPDNGEHGLHFICLNANISRQFEFVQSAWIMNSKFNCMTGETDPLLGNRIPMANGQPTDSFLIPQESGLARRISGVPQFVTVRGGAYFFLPGIKALKFLATAYVSK
jgi:deferrochelatase/peroxidase EfeB